MNFTKFLRCLHKFRQQHIALDGPAVTPSPECLRSIFPQIHWPKILTVRSETTNPRGFENALDCVPVVSGFLGQYPKCYETPVKR